MKRVDSEGRRPLWKKGDRVYVTPLKMEATIIEQVLHHDGSESFWGNVCVRYDDGVEGTSNCWQIMKVVK
jgi:hypothetical protein